MEGKPRPEASSAQALAGMDRLIALSIVGQHDIAQRLGLNVTDLTCLAHIWDFGDEPPTAGDLAEKANLTTGAITGVVNRLERAGYARRQADPADRRRVRIIADASAAARVAVVYQPFYDRLSELFADYSPDEVAVLADWFTRAADAMRLSLEEIRGKDSRTAS
ncbi:MarR family winged helix-turn-helix transcriptional regulator [Planomonospora parontospora]|uniref:MarR family winged helix-turn-helix transcriptional regulator n=1 Tax=Planomonospora parontospora TaxID=58119 RepID=UPI00166F671E|nr:MarR family transcriptional regulator [Planomonospora parontospora]GGL24092.1 putative HTH-type transcriptional regulator YcgE [Planomonospora parontospora subsp. antibiotica]GII15084.1 putative HTH-type transcriptional regulator YcgE [Planomonospora parontospora subsp. antibiotica]